MHQLIAIQTSNINNETKQTVNARDLHSFLEVGKDFSTWMKDRIESFGFVENQDFVCSPILGSNGRGGHNRVDYHLALDMAKELSMVERNAKGKQARQYFIECEKVAKQQLIPQTLPEALRLAADLAEQNAMLAPKAAIADRLIISEDAVSLSAAAKVFNIPPQRFIKELNRLEWIYKRPGSTNWLGYQDKINAGYLDHKFYQYTKDDGSEGSKPQVLVLPKGMAKLTKIYGQTELFQ